MLPSNAEFAALTEPFRPELLAHCYRLLGSIHDAEDLVQETYLRAWRGFDRFEGRSSVRRWLYKIATMACLTALESRARRPLPSGLGPPSDDRRAAVAPLERAVAWLQPVPDALLDTDDPSAIVVRRSAVRLAFVAALQVLPARQRAVLTLRDVLAFRTAEVAEMLDTTTAAVDSALRRARAHLHQVGPVQDDLAEPDEESRQALLERYVDAFTRADARRAGGPAPGRRRDGDAADPDVVHRAAGRRRIPGRSRPAPPGPVAPGADPRQRAARLRRPAAHGRRARGVRHPGAHADRPADRPHHRVQRPGLVPMFAGAAAVSSRRSPRTQRPPRKPTAPPTATRIAPSASERPVKRQNNAAATMVRATTMPVVRVRRPRGP